MSSRKPNIYARGPEQANNEPFFQLFLNREASIGDTAVPVQTQATHAPSVLGVCRPISMPPFCGAETGESISLKVSRIYLRDYKLHTQKKKTKKKR